MSDNVDGRNVSGGPDLDTSGREDPGVSNEKEGSPTNARVADERSGAPLKTHGPDPSGDDPFHSGARENSSGNEEPDNANRRVQEVGPSYEVDQDPEDHVTGGSSDPANTRSFTDSGNESNRR